MRRAAAVTVVAALFLWPAVSAARMHAPYRGHRIMPANAAPLDGFTSPSGAYGFRRLRTAYAGSALRIRRASDNLEADIGFVGNDFNIAAATAHCAATTCAVRWWYDQSGNARDLGQPSSSPTFQPLLIFNCQGSLPCIRTNDPLQGLVTTANVTPATGTVTLNAVGTKVSGTGGCFFIRQNGTTGNRLAGQSAAQNWSANGGTSGSIVAAAPYAAWHSGTAVMNGASSSLVIDGTTTAGTTVGSVTAGPAGMGSPGASTVCDQGEAVTWDNYVTTPAEIAALTSNQQQYWMPLPLDSLTSPSGAYGFRKLRSAWAGSAIRLRRASDNLEADIGFLGFVPGLGAPLDVAAATAHCAATTCFGAKWYDQSGNTRDLLQATPTNQPQLVFNCKDTLPCWQYTANTQVLQAGATITPASGTVSFSAVGMRSGGVGSFSLLAENGAAGNRIALSGTAATWGVFGGTSGSVTVASATEGAWHSLQANLAAASSVVNVDGTETTGTATGSITAALPRITGPAAGTTASQVEAVFWDNYQLTAPERAGLVNNQRGFWGF